MMIVTTDTCHACAHWSNHLPTLASGVRRPEGSDPNRGSCHLYSPTVFIAAGLPMSLFPETHADQTCGEWLADGLGDGGGGEKADNVVPIGRAA